ncbi:sensor domain-containing diguanylate cyclase [Undibacterium fentianense]|uniref:diguanylate cyclase n=1 Tax=Undibacterium fentianense TaxID=2828728 RepID=A0A941E6D6_9BURK|nr:sensor domain-containing diguanylate cyclase [Undibacterium fentianense]MBR7801806.1 GGDEF domain-containing protein [Undibacterium fentianense]
MSKSYKQYSLLIWISVILILGFIAVLATSYLVSKDALRRGLSENTLPITGDNIYSEIQKDVLRPVFVSSQMANDTFVRDWMLDGEQDPSQISKYLKEIKLKNNAISSFLVSDLTKNYYYPEGLLKSINQTDARDQWFFRVKNLKSAYETNVDIDLANHDSMTIFTNYRVLDYQGKFMGAVGIGLTLDTMKHLIDNYQNRFQRKIYFVDKKGNVVLASNSLKRQTNILNSPGIDQVAKLVLSNAKNDSLHLEYTIDDEAIYLNSRFIPELGWHLLVEQNLATELKPLQKLLMVNAGIGLGITIAVLLIVLLSVRHYQNRIEKSAATDSLTKLLNRQAFDFVFQQAILDSERSRQPLCVALMDIDHFKKINDKHGHLVGDHVLREIAAISRRSLRESDVICRWGGEEFLLLLKNCSLEKATSIAENLRSTIAANDFSRTTDLTKGRLSLTVSMGVAECRSQESEDSVFERADVALYQAKESGRNSVYFSE